LKVSSGPQRNTTKESMPSPDASGVLQLFLSPWRF
jgi:hypothetical protein